MPLPVAKAEHGPNLKHLLIDIMYLILQIYSISYEILKPTITLLMLQYKCNNSYFNKTFQILELLEVLGSPATQRGLDLL